MTVAILLAIPVLSACLQHEIKSEQRTSLTSKDIAFHNAKRDACLSLRGGDKRLIAVKGYGIYFPGVPENFHSARQARFILIEDTSDSSKDWIGSKYNIYARKYAANYNATILSPVVCSN